MREIVSIQTRDVISVKGRRAFDVRGEIVHLVGISDLFDWNLIPGAIPEASESISEPDADTMGRNSGESSLDTTAVCCIRQRDGESDHQVGSRPHTLMRKR